MHGTSNSTRRPVSKASKLPTFRFITTITPTGSLGTASSDKLPLHRSPFWEKLARGTAMSSDDEYDGLDNGVDWQQSRTARNKLLII